MPRQPRDLGDLAAALDLGRNEHIAIVGGGGKTTTLFALGEQLGPTAILTTTTKMGSDRDDGRFVAIDPSDEGLVQAVSDHRRVLVWGSRGEHRAEGVAPDDCDRWFEGRLADHVIVEADGSRGRPFKAPYAYEPVVPSSCTLVIACIGAGALNRPIGEVCLRDDAVIDIVGGSVDDPLTPEAAATVLLSPSGSRKGLPASARFAVVVQQVSGGDRPAVDELVDRVQDHAAIVTIAERAGLPERP